MNDKKERTLVENRVTMHTYTTDFEDEEIRYAAQEIANTSPCKFEEEEIRYAAEEIANTRSMSV